METCVTPKDVGWGGRKRWAVMSHNEATAASPGAGAQRAGAGRSQTGVPVPLQGPVLKCECPGNRGAASQKKGISSAENNPEGMP